MSNVMEVVHRIGRTLNRRMGCPSSAPPLKKFIVTPPPYAPRSPLDGVLTAIQPCLLLKKRIEEYVMDCHETTHGTIEVLSAFSSSQDRPGHADCHVSRLARVTGGAP